MKRILYLDKDPSNTISRKEIPELIAEIIPETAAHLMWSTQLPESVKVLRDQALNPTVDPWAFKNPPDSVLRKILQLTQSGEFQLIIIGNNQGVGGLKAAYVAEHLRPMTIITSHRKLHPAERAFYERLGFSQFVTRDLLCVRIRELLNLPS